MSTSTIAPMSRTTPTDNTETAVPTLRVMRLQSPELHQNSAGTLEGHSLLDRSLCLPDSLEVYVGECFTAYLGILNTSADWPIRRLTISAQLQTPSQRWQLPSQLDSGNASGGIDIEPLSGVDSIVSHAIEEPGQHILRVEVGYMTTEGGSKTFRKFYRFQVTAPLTIRHSTVRSGDSCCFVSVDVEYNLKENAATGTPLVISDANFFPVQGLSSEMVSSTAAGVDGVPSADESKTALDLFDNATVLTPGGCFRYLFKVEASTKEAILRGIAAEDMIGRAVFRWRKAMGETGECSSNPVFCPRVQPFAENGHYAPNYVVHRSGLSVDVASAAATAAARPDRAALLSRLPVTVEPIDPPTRMKLSIPQEVQFLVVNHTEQSMPLQFQIQLSHMMAVCGPSFQSLGQVAPRGGSTVVTARFLPLAAGLVRVQGCAVVDLATGQEILQPPLFHAFVEIPQEEDVSQ